MIKRVLLLLFCLVWALPLYAAEGYFIGDIVIEGNQRVKKQAVIDVLPLQAGQAVLPVDIDAAIQAIYRLGRFSDVVAEVEQRNGVQILVFRLEERPLVRKIRFEGNEEIKTNKLQKLITIKVPDIYDPYEIARSVDAVKLEYIKEGYYAAEVTADSHVGPENDSLVTFRIDEGRLVRIKQIEFAGNAVFDHGDLMDMMDSREKWFLSWMTGRGNYNDILLSQDLERIADNYFDEGYVRVKVREPVITLVDDNRHMLVLITIDESNQYLIGEIDAQGDLIQREGEILNLVPLQPGDVFSRKLLRFGVEKVTDLYANQGYAYANVTPLTRVNDDTRLVDLNFEIEQGPQVSVERINVSGNMSTRDKVVRREMKLVEGELFNASALKRSRARINNLGYFEAVDITTSKGSDENHINIDINVKERPTGTFSIGAGYSSVDGFVGQGSITQENFLGRGWRLSLAASVGGESSTYQIGLTDPYFLDMNLTLGFELYKTDREWTDFSRRATGGAIKVGRAVGEYSRILFVYRYEQKDIYDVDPFASQDIQDEEGSSTISSITSTFSRNTTDYRPDPSRGGAFDASWEFAGLGGTEQFSKYLLDYRHFWPAFWGTTFSAHGRVGYVHAYASEDIPLDERFYLGGINSLRGFDSREVGPIDPDTLDYIGGDKQTFFNFEFLFPLAKDLGMKGVVFFDVGNAWGEDEDWFEEWRYSAGAGIRWLSPLGPLRLEWGYNLDPKEGEDDSKLEFMVGRFF
ncbi:MAG: outer membrane protein assembly factor BamA [Desulfuromonadales bacterium]|nr:outer membrane protein assembly factor BamA [Desulfuromonadales bacterium]